MEPLVAEVQVFFRSLITKGTSRTSMVVEQVNQKTPIDLFLLQCIKDITMDEGLYDPLWDMYFFHYFQVYTNTFSNILHFPI